MKLRTAGTVHPGEFYIDRQADAELYDGLLRGDFCHVLAPRQIGKSSLRVRTMDRLRSAGIRCAGLDLTRLGYASTGDRIRTWYVSLMHAIARELKLPDPLDFAAQHLHRLPLSVFVEYVQEAVIGNVPGSVVIFLDEIDYVRTVEQHVEGFSSDEFFAAIRSLCNQSAEDSRLCRLSFCLLGVLAPGDLIRQPEVTSYNIGRPVKLEDFSRKQVEQLEPLLIPLGGEPRDWGDELYRITSGHPYMTSSLVDHLLRQSQHTRGSGSIARCIAQAAEDVFIRAGTENSNLGYAEHRFEQSSRKEELLSLYRKLRLEKPVRVASADPVQQELRLCGMAAESLVDNILVLRVRNRIFERVFDQNWIEEKESKRALRAAVRRWRESGQSRDSVLRGSELHQAVDWIRHNPRHATADEHELLHASQEVAAVELAAAERQAAQQRELVRERLAAQRQQRYFAAVFALVLVATIATAVGLLQRRQSLLNKQDAIQASARLTEAHFREAKALLQREQAVLSAAEAAKRVAQADAATAREAAERSKAEAVASRERAARLLSEKENAVTVAKTAKLARESAEKERRLIQERLDRSLENRVKALPKYEGTDASARSVVGLAIPILSEMKAKGLSPSISHYQREIWSRLLEIWTQSMKDGGRPRALAPAGAADSIMDISYSSDSRFLLTRSASGRIRIWDLTRGVACYETRPSIHVSTGLFLPTDNRILWGTSGGLTDLFWFESTPDEGCMLQREHSYAGHSNRMLRVVADRTMLLSIDREQARLWNADGGHPQTRQQGLFTSAVLLSDVRAVVLGDATGKLIVWQPEMSAPAQVLPAHVGPVTALAVSGSRTHLISGGRDGKVYSWNSSTEQNGRVALRKALLSSSSSAISDAVFVPASRWAITADHSGDLRVHDSLARQPSVGLPNGLVNGAAINSIAVHPSGTQLLTASDDGAVKLWPLHPTADEVPPATAVPLVLLGHGGAVSVAHYSPDGTGFASAGVDGRVLVYETDQTENPLMLACLLYERLEKEPALFILEHCQQEMHSNPARERR